MAARHLSQLGYKQIRVMTAKPIKDDIKYLEQSLDAEGIALEIFQPEYISFNEVTKENKNSKIFLGIAI